MIPDDAVGIVAADNGNPLQFRYNEFSTTRFHIGERTDTSMEMIPNSESARATSTFLGGIVSSDRETVYWVNETRPIP